MRPTEYLGRSAPGEPWSIRDRGLAEALILHEQGIGPHGQPLRLALDDDNGGWFEAEWRTDHAQAAIDQARKEIKDVGPGMFPVVKFTRKRG